MTIQKRRCGNCAAFGHSNIDPCGNLVTFTINQGTPLEEERGARADDYCPEHLTAEEYDCETELIESIRDEGGTELVVQRASSIVQTWRAMRRARGTL